MYRLKQCFRCFGASTVYILFEDRLWIIDSRILDSASFGCSCYRCSMCRRLGSSCPGVDDQVRVLEISVICSCSRTDIRPPMEAKYRIYRFLSRPPVVASERPEGCSCPAIRSDSPRFGVLESLSLKIKWWRRKIAVPLSFRDNLVCSVSGVWFRTHAYIDIKFLVSYSLYYILPLVKIVRPRTMWGGGVNSLKHLNKIILLSCSSFHLRMYLSCAVPVLEKYRYPVFDSMSTGTSLILHHHININNN